MISRLTGVLSEKAPPFVLVDVNGVGYEVQVPMSTFYNLPELGAKVTLLTQFIVREDAQLLYGFLTPTERASFRELIKISGVGPRIALALLSGLNTEELAQAVAAQDTSRLVKVPGIGKKTAEAGRLERQVGGGNIHAHAAYHDRHEFLRTQFQAEVIYTLHCFESVNSAVRHYHPRGRFGPAPRRIPRLLVPCGFDFKSGARCAAGGDKCSRQC